MKMNEVEESVLKDTAKDYVEFEKKSLLAMWAGPFICNMEEKVKRHGWKIGLLIMFGICLLRGLFGVIFHTRSFLEGFSYPFILFFVISIITFPLFLINRKYKDADLSGEAPIRDSKMIKVLKVVAAISYLPVVFFGALILSEDVYFNSMMGNTPYVASSKLFLLYFLVGLYLFAVFIWLYSKKGLFSGIEGNEGIKAHLPGKVKTKVAVISVIIYLLTLAAYNLCYDCFTEEGMIRQIFFYSKEYTWQDVDYYTMSANFDGTLKLTVVMKDGIQADCLGFNVGMSNLPEDQYPNDTDDFCRYLVESFAEEGIELRVDWDHLEEKLSYDYWKEYAEDIRKIAGESNNYTE